MAEIILAAVLEVVFEKLTSTALKKLACSKGIDSQLKKWNKLLSHIRAVLIDASDKEMANESVKLWLNALQHVAYDIEDVLDELATRATGVDGPGAGTTKVATLVQTCCTSFSVTTRMKDKMKDISTRLQDLAEEKDTLGLIGDVGRSKNTNRRPESTSLIDESGIVGRQGDKEALLRMLLGDGPCNQNFSIVPIVGLGGIGKTTLARLLYNEARVKDHFEHKAWVCVSDEFDIFKITKIIFQSVTGEDTKEFADLNLLQVALKERLSEKRFLLVLDDVWSESYADWEILARPFIVGATGSKIIFTTRKQQLLSQLGYDLPYHLQILSDDDALSLFAQHALGENSFDSHLMLKSYGEGIVKRCGGLPLALIALGRLLRTKANEEDWENLLNSEIWMLQNENEIIPALRLSYKDLPAHLKRLFAYCSLFPKDYIFDKEELVLLWMAEGFLHQSTTSMSPKALGHRYFEELLSRSFFERASNEESFYLMHDLMNDLSMFVAGDFFFRMDDEMNFVERSEALGKYRHMSFIRKNCEAYSRFKAFRRAKNVRTFLAVSVRINSLQDFYLSNKILVELLPQLPLLRVLCLSDYDITEVPEFICSLRHLRYLNLSRTRITNLPLQVGKLCNLQTLLVFGCKSLMNLPNSFFKLKNLQHLDISDTPLLDKIDYLKSKLNLSKVTIQGRNRFKINELKELGNLNKRITIYGLEEVRKSTDLANLLQKKDLIDLKMEWGDVVDISHDGMLEKEVLGMLKPRSGQLRKLEFMSYGGTEFPRWVGDPSFILLAHLTIHSCKRCTSLPPLGQLPLLKELFVKDMDGVKVVGCELLGNGSCSSYVAFPSLEILGFEEMHEWEVWLINNRVTSEVFPCLRELRINGCSKLIELTLKSIPSLRVLDISGCHDVVLRSVVRVAQSINTFRIWNISGLTQLDQGVIEYLGRVESIRIGCCDEVKYLWESEAKAFEILKNLRNLSIYECGNLVRLEEKKEGHCGSDPTSIRKLEIYRCSGLENLSCQNNTETLRIHHCPSITSVSFPSGRQKLKILSVWDCEKLLEDELRGGEKSRVLLETTISSLEYIRIRNWSNLKSFPDLKSFVHLTALLIENCMNLKSFPDDQLPTLISLTTLSIESCPLMDDSFPRGLWPPNLSSLSLGGLKKPVLEWGQQNFPTSLVTLVITGSSADDIGSSTLFPSSLTLLCIINFGKSESLSTKLQDVTSLKHLWISNCPKIKDLPETLLPSLLSLIIFDCRKLEEKYNRRGSHWPLISHIPNIQI